MLGSYRYADYGVLGKGVEQGIALHEGRRFGWLNLLANLALCLRVLFMAVTGPMMWWRRGPKGSLSAPRRAADVKTVRGVGAVILIIGVLFPLGGISMQAILPFDRFVLRRILRLAQTFE
ncbi:MAG: PepSY domain-containing protein [Egibacteraceae bacterium]